MFSHITDQFAMARKKRTSAKLKQKKKPWGSKQVLASSFAPTIPPPRPDALEKALLLLLSIFPQPFVHRPSRPRPSSTTTNSTPSLSTPTAPRTTKPKHLFCGLNQVTRALEKQRVSLVVVAKDVTPAILVAHIPVLCFLSQAALVVLPGDGREVGQLFGVRRVLAFAVEKVGQGEGEASEVARKLTEGLMPLTVSLAFPWLEAARGKAVPPFPDPVLVPHQRKIDIG